MAVSETVIIIPYRDRKEHLSEFVKNAVPLIQKNMKRTKVLVVEQDNDSPFNRGALINIGAAECKTASYFITHDVDIHPDERTLVGIYNIEKDSVFRIKSAHANSLGGIVKIPRDAFFDINGFPNYIWGWGIEDRALYFRCYIRGLRVDDSESDMFTYLHHKKNDRKYTGDLAKISERWTKMYIDELCDEEKNNMVEESGINNIKYVIKERIQLHDIVELIKVDAF